MNNKFFFYWNHKKANGEKEKKNKELKESRKEWKYWIKWEGNLGKSELKNEMEFWVKEKPKQALKRKTKMLKGIQKRGRKEGRAKKETNKRGRKQTE